MLYYLMLYPIHAGSDWSGRASLTTKQPDVLIACFVALEDVERLKVRFDALRLKTFGDSDAELHAHKMQPLRIADGLRIGIELEMRVAALCIDKITSDRMGTLPPASDFHALIALRAWDDLLAINPISRLVYDTEIEGKARQRSFESEIKRRSTQIYPSQKLKVKPLPSHKSDLIQLADIVAYELSRQFHNKKIEPYIKVLMEQIQADPRNFIRGPQIWIP